MDTLKKLFPYSFGVKDLGNMIVKIIVYLVVGAVMGFVISLFGKLPLIGIVASLVGWLVELYVFVAIVLVVLSFLKIVK